MADVGVGVGVGVVGAGVGADGAVLAIGVTSSTK
jgi:hypothetical protein